jgi:hypothetical protein
MYQGKYGAVIGLETRFFANASKEFQPMGFLKPITEPYLPWYIKPKRQRNFSG